MSVSRMIRKSHAPSTRVPGKSSCTLCRMTSSRNTKVEPSAGAPAAGGTGTKRGSMSGTLTRANFVRPPCRTTTAKFMLRFEM